MVPNSAKMYVGNMFFDDKYVVWDQTPIQNDKQDYIQIGIGVANPLADIGEIQYGVYDPLFKPLDREWDSSTTIKGHTDPYLMEEQIESTARAFYRF